MQTPLLSHRITTTGQPPQLENKKTLQQAHTELNQRIDEYAKEMFGRVNLTPSERIYFAKIIYQIKPEDVAKLPTDHIVARVHSCLLTYLYIAQKQGKEKSELMNLDKSSMYAIQQKLDTLNEKVSNIPWGVSSITGIYASGRQIMATNMLNVASAGIGVLKSMQDGFCYCYEKCKIHHLEKQLAKKNTALKALGPQDLNTVYLVKDISTINADLAIRRGKVKQIIEGGWADALLGPAYLATTVAGILLKSQAATLAGAAIGGVGYSAIWAANSIIQMKMDAKRMKLLDVKEKKLETIENKIKPAAGKPPTLLQKAITLKRDNIVSHKKQNLWFNQINNGSNSAMAIISGGFGAMPLLAKAGVVISATAVSSTGIGLAVVIGVSVAIALGIMAYQYYKRSRSPLKSEIAKLETDLIKNQVELREASTQLISTTEAFQGESKIVNQCLKLNQKIEQQQLQLMELKARYQVVSQAGDKVTIDIFDSIETMEEGELNAAADDFSLAFTSEDGLGPDLSGVTELPDKESKRLYLKAKLGEWITA